MSLVTDAETFESQVQRLYASDPALIADPYPLYARMRREHPVFRMGPLVSVATYDGVKHVLGHPEVFSSERAESTAFVARRDELTPEQRVKFDEFLAFLGLWLPFNDEPAHSEIRGAVREAFTPRKVNEMREEIQAIVDELLDRAAARGELDLVPDFSYPLPLRVVSALLGAPQERMADMREWSDQIAIAVGTNFSNIDAAHAAMESFRELVRDMVAARRASGDASGIFGALVLPEGDAAISDDQIVSMCVLLLFAGHETTTNLIGNALLALFENPDQLQRLREDPALIRGTIEEILRYNNAVQVAHRTAIADTDILGFPVKKGETVRVLFGAANRDESVFDDAERFDIARKTSTRHLGMGYGIHSCLGIWLAKLEVDIALTTLLDRFPDLRLDASEVAWNPVLTLHGAKNIRFVLGPERQR
ncbi:cytochrome P450 [Microbacterium sp. No. 7]|uniref:cytochrome P450 n=1 Tax=Microbacterium sp. No. 7 TaxID=1714373 RepID=UPI0006D04E50|nr:cytochrome P450 [Microbacterium sp. No. 7]ALJ18880.1 hypothetical protein AOA12_02720 [Microbacterium sp. No. 7]